MDRNVITSSDAIQRQNDLKKFEDIQRQNILLRHEKGLNQTTKAEETPAVKLPAQIVQDTWSDKLLKYIPIEAIGLYLALETAIRSAALTESEGRLWLAIALVSAMLFCFLYLRITKKVVRLFQIFISLFALIVWVFALGGVFATFGFYKPWHGTIALILSSAFLGFIDPPGALPPLNFGNEPK